MSYRQKQFLKCSCASCVRYLPHLGFTFFSIRLLDPHKARCFPEQEPGLHLESRQALVRGARLSKVTQRIRAVSTPS